MQAGAAGLRLGKILVLFPEGERSIDGELKKFRKGAPILSSHLQAPIVPVALDGLFDLWPRGRSLQWRLFKPWKRPRVTYEFGQPMNVARARMPRNGRVESARRRDAGWNSTPGVGAGELALPVQLVARGDLARRRRRASSA
jgi:1-acyl-sn-glycerol-3-phosphate acyltransferase